MRRNINGVELKYEFKTDKSAGKTSIAIVRASDIQGDFTIPVAIDGYAVTHIGESAFYQCIGLTRVIIPDGVTKIARYAFAGCRELKSVEISATVMDIGYHAFDDCGELRSFSVAEDNPNYKSVSRLLLTKDGKTLVNGIGGDVIIPEGVTEIDWMAFVGRSGLTGVTMPDSVVHVGRQAFYNCENLKDLEMSQGMKDIGTSAFEGCKALTSVTIPEGVTRIGSGAFSNCRRLVHVSMPSSATDIGWNAFSGCDALNGFSVVESNPNYKSVSGLLLTKDGKTLLRGVNGDVAIPDGVTVIGQDAFAGFRDLTSIVMPASVTSIKFGAFLGCGNLKSVVIPNSVTSIGDLAFHDCVSLANVTIPTGVTSIGTLAFASTALETVYVAVGDAERVKKLFLDSGLDIKGIKFLELKNA